MAKKAMIIILTIFLFIPLLFYTIFTFQDIYTVSKFAQTLYDYPLPPKTEVIQKYANYGISYGGDPYGSGDQATAVAFIKLSSELSEEELLDYYNEISGIDVYFEGDEKLMETRSKVWYEGSTPSNPSSESNEGDPITLIVQMKTIFNSPLGELAGI